MTVAKKGKQAICPPTTRAVVIFLNPGEGALFVEMDHFYHNLILLNYHNYENRYENNFDADIYRGINTLKMWG